MEPLIQVDDLHVVFPMPRGNIHAVRGVSFEIGTGQIYGIVGESGCGKTATGRAILQLVPAPGKIVGGRILFHGEDLLQKSEQEIRKLRGQRIAMIFQDAAAALNPLFTIGQQLMGIMKHHQIAAGRELSRLAVELLGDLGLPRPKNMLETYPHQLSGGMQQRAMIAMALSAGPDLIIADEPTSALDVTIQSQILDLLVKLQRDRGVAIMMISHDLGIVAETCEQMAVFYLGQIIEQGAVGDIFHDPKHPYTKGLLAALPNPKNWGDKLKAIPGSVPTLLEAIQGCAFAPRCEYVMGICTQKTPPLIQFSTTHRATCHLYVDDIKHRDGEQR